MSYAYSKRKKERNKARRKLPEMILNGAYPMNLLPQQLQDMGEEKAAETIRQHEESKRMLKKLIRQGKASRFVMVKYKDKIIPNGEFKTKDGQIKQVGPWLPQVNALSVYK